VLRRLGRAHGSASSCPYTLAAGQRDWPRPCLMAPGGVPADALCQRTGARRSIEAAVDSSAVRRRSGRRRRRARPSARRGSGRRRSAAAARLPTRRPNCAAARHHRPRRAARAVRLAPVIPSAGWRALARARPPCSCARCIGPGRRGSCSAPGEMLGVRRQAEGSASGMPDAVRSGSGGGSATAAAAAAANGGGRPPGGGGYYETLGVAPGVGGAEIRRAYWRQATLTHPDKGGSDEAFAQARGAPAPSICPVRPACAGPRALKRILCLPCDKSLCVPPKNAGRECGTGMRRADGAPRVSGLRVPGQTCQSSSRAGRWARARAGPHGVRGAVRPAAARALRHQAVRGRPQRRP